MKTLISRSVDYIINCSMEKFTELLSSEGLSEDQAACCRDIRRRGKNKVSSVFEGFLGGYSEDKQNKVKMFLEGNYFLG